MQQSRRCNLMPGHISKNIFALYEKLSALLGSRATFFRKMAETELQYQKIPLADVAYLNLRTKHWKRFFMGQRRAEHKMLYANAIMQMYITRLNGEMEDIKQCIDSEQGNHGTK